MAENKCIDFLTKGAKRLDLELNCVESCRLEQNNEKKHLDKDGYSFVFVSEGECSLEFSGKKIFAKSGTCAIILPKENFSVSCTGGQAASYYRLGLGGIGVIKILEGYSKTLVDSGLCFETDSFKAEILKKYLDRILKCDLEFGQAEYVMACGYFYLIAYELLETKEDKVVFDKKSFALWQNVCDYISANYDSPISVDSLAEKLNCHRTTLYRLFKKNSGMSPVEYVLNFKLEKACFLVKNTKELYVDIAFNCGFNDVAYFYRLFKRKYKKTPRQMREES